MRDNHIDQGYDIPEDPLFFYPFDSFEIMRDSPETNQSSEEVPAHISTSSLGVPTHISTSSFLVHDEDSTLDVIEDEEDNVPNSFLCPIGHQIMRNPAVDIDGYSYELSAIVEWLRHDSSSPITRKRMTINDLRPNRALQSAISEYMSSKHNRQCEPVQRDPANEELQSLLKS